MAVSAILCYFATNTFMIMEERKQLEDFVARMKEIAALTHNEQLALADEALHVYAPLADRLGLEDVKDELQDVGFRYSEPEKYEELKRLLAESEAMCEMTFNTFIMPIRSLLDATGIKYELLYRMKSPYSVYRKMRNKNCEFDDVYDLFACRVIYEVSEGELENLRIAGDHVGRKLDDSFLDREKLDCWRIYTVFTSLYRLLPERTRDYITHPRANGYQALQFTLMGPDCTWIEVQIRSRRMHEDAEYGSSAHWKYKAGQVI